MKKTAQKFQPVIGNSFFFFGPTTPGVKRLVVDRDNTIVRDSGYLHELTDFEFMPGALEGLLAFRDLEFEISIFTNQSGVSRGYYTVEQMIVFNNFLIEKLGENGVSVCNLVACYHLPSHNCDCRKPKNGMIRELINISGLDPYNCFILGDKETDLETGAEWGIPGYLINSSTDWYASLDECRRHFCL